MSDMETSSMPRRKEPWMHVPYSLKTLVFISATAARPHLGA